MSDDVPLLDILPENPGDPSSSRLSNGSPSRSRLRRASASATTGDAREELVAELSASFLCADLAITPETREDHVAYLAHWLEILREDKRAIFLAAAHAQGAVDFLHGVQSIPERAPRVTDESSSTLP